MRIEQLSDHFDSSRAIPAHNTDTIDILLDSCSCERSNNCALRLKLSSWSELELQFLRTPIPMPFPALFPFFLLSDSGNSWKFRFASSLSICSFCLFTFSLFSASANRENVGRVACGMWHAACWGDHDNCRSKNIISYDM